VSDLYPVQRPMNAPERFVARLFVTRLGAWFGLHILPRLDRPVLFATRGRLSLSPGQPILLLITTGAKSGRQRTTPVLYLRDGDHLLVFASNGGRAHHPAWYYNVRAQPRVTAMVNGRVRSFVATELTGAERAAVWERAVAYYAGFKVYEQRIAREIPVLRLSPAPPEPENERVAV
jgi:F420H(2)-dependent quinone reductase